MKKQLNAVKDFHEKFGLSYNHSPTVELEKKIIELRFNLMKEENEEYIEAARNNDIIDGKPIYREDGKVMKGPNYFKPNFTKFFS